MKAERITAICYKCPECKDIIQIPISTKSIGFCHCSRWISVKKNEWITTDDKNNVFGEWSRIK